MNLTFVRLWEKSSHANLGMLYISSYLKKYSSNLGKVSYLDQEKFSIKELKKTKPDIIGFASVTPNFINVKNAAEQIKEELDIPIVIGGPHITSLPKSIPTYIDIGVMGEGEDTFLELFNKEFEKLDTINGIAYFEKHKLKINQKRKLIEPLDGIPFPDRDLLDPKKYFIPQDILTTHEKVRGTNMITSRGCPYNCVPAGTMITLANGTKQDIKEFVQNPSLVLSYNKGQIVASEIQATQVFKNDILIEIETADGTKLKLTPDHMIFTKRGWIKAQNLLTNDEVLLNR